MTNQDLSRQQREKILGDRAKLLAREKKQEITAEEDIRVIEFKLSNENYAIESMYVREVLPFREFTPVPCTPSYVLGIINIRGQILSVIDLKTIFKLSSEVPVTAGKIIVLASNEMELGIVADAVIGVRSFSLDQLHTGLPTLTDIREVYLRGILGDNLVFINTAKLLDDQSLIVNEKIEV